MGLLPIVIRIGRAKYINWLAHRSSVHPTMEGLTESSRLLGNGGSQSAQRRPHVARTTTQERIEGSERFDLYFGGLSFLVDAVGFTAIGLSKRRWHLYACERKGARKAACPFSDRFMPSLCCSDCTVEFVSSWWAQRSSSCDRSGAGIDVRSSAGCFVSYR